jgi:hypothetical protein
MRIGIGLPNPLLDVPGALLPARRAGAERDVRGYRGDEVGALADAVLEPGGPRVS